MDLKRKSSQEKDLCQTNSKKKNIGTPENQKAGGSSCHQNVAHAFTGMELTELLNVPIVCANLEEDNGSGGGGSNGKGLANDLRLDENQLVEVHVRSDKETNVSQDKGKATFDEAVDGLVGVTNMKLNSEKEIDKNHTIGSSFEHLMVGGSSRGGNSGKRLDNDIFSDGNELVEISKSKDKGKAIFDLNESVWPEDEPFSNTFEKNCEHSWIWKLDSGHVCWICGIIDKDHPLPPGFGSNNSKDFNLGLGTGIFPHPLPSGFGSNSSEDVNPGLGTGIFPHPLHQSCMDLRQIEIFNFLCNNLAVENPNGCILAQAPVSEKTFLLINFTYGYLAKHPDSKILFVLPKSMFDFWKSKFDELKVNDIMLLDFYSAKANNRSQQLEVLNRWINNRSIIFLCTKQVSNIVSTYSCGEEKASNECRDILLHVPTLVIFDRGTDPKNEMMSFLGDVARIKTPQKVLLISALYRNNIKEVFTILDVVFPEFLKHNQIGQKLRKVLDGVADTHERPSMYLEMPDKLEEAFYKLDEALLSVHSDHGDKVAYLTELRMLTKKVIYNHNGEFLHEVPGLTDFTVVLKPTLSQKSAWEIEKNTRNKGFKTCSTLSGITLHPVLSAYSDRVKGLPAPNKDEMDELIKSIDEADGIKTKFFLGLVKLCECTNEKILVVSQYVIPLIFLQRLVAKLKGWKDGKETFMVRGDTSLSAREVAVHQFNNSHDAKIFFASIKACNEQMDLTGATRVLMLDIIANPCLAREAIELAYRRGQQKKVFSYRLVAADTSEEDEDLTAARKEIISGIWLDGKTYPADGKFCIPTIDGNFSDDYFLGSSYMRDDIKTLHKR